MNQIAISHKGVDFLIGECLENNIKSSSWFRVYLEYLSNSLSYSITISCHDDSVVVYDDKQGVLVTGVMHYIKKPILYTFKPLNNENLYKGISAACNIIYGRLQKSSSDREAIEKHKQREKTEEFVEDFLYEFRQDNLVWVD